jgi:hypothetical protein
VLAAGYDYFGGVMAQQFKQTFGIQKVQEEAVARVNQSLTRKADGQLSEGVQKLYEGFYYSGLFQPEGGFRKELEANMTRRFYSPPGEQPRPMYLQARLADFRKLIDGGVNLREQQGPPLETAGYLDSARKNQASRTPFDQQYIRGWQRYLLSLFCGRHLPPKQPFIGDLVWGPDQGGRPAIKTLDYDRREEEIKDLLHWIYQGCRNYAGVPDVGRLFGSLQQVAPLQPAGPSPETGTAGKSGTSGTNGTQATFPKE